MISICTCGINCAHDLKTFVEFTEINNLDCEHEICFTWDNRFNDETGKTIEFLTKKYSNFKIVENTERHVLNYLENLLSYYEKENLFSKEFRDHLSRNLDLVKRNKFLDKETQYLWISSGPLYNKAVSVASGKNLVITPCDYIYLYKLSLVDEYINNHTINEEFYGKPNALRFHLGNKVEKGHAYRDPSLTFSLDQYFLFNEKKGEKLFLSDGSFFNKVKDFIRKGIDQKEFLYNYHGQHFITRKFFDKVGGFTEEWYGRAWADDKLTSIASFDFRHHWKILPEDFCFPLTLITLNKATSIYLHKGFDISYIQNLPVIFDEQFSSKDKSLSGRLSSPLKFM